MNDRRLAIACIIVAFAFAGCASVKGDDADSAALNAEGSAMDVPVDDPPATTPWHKEPIIDRAHSRNIVLLNHADATFALDGICAMLQRQFDFLADYVGVAPHHIYVHIGSSYPSGFTLPIPDRPEVFLQAGSIFDSEANYAHEMMHAFMARFGAAPHWFSESIADVAYVDSEIELWKRRKEAPWLATFDRIDNRSYELLRVRVLYGANCFRKFYRNLERHFAETQRMFSAATTLEEKNNFLLDELSLAIGEDIRPLFLKEFGFNPRTRERQRGY